MSELTKTEGQMNEYSYGIPAWKLRLRLCIVEFIYNCSIACGSFLTVFLQSLGVTPGSMGIINSIMNVAGFTAPPIWGVVADKIGSCKRIFIITLTVAAVINFFVPIAATSTWLPIVLVTFTAVLASMFSNPANSMMESWLAQVSSHSGGKISYGSMRLWASIGYAVTGIAISPLLKKINVGYTYQIYGIFVIPAILLAITIPDMRTRSAQKKTLAEMPFKKLGNYWMVTYVIFFVLFGLPTGWSSQYFPFLVSHFGGGASEIATFMAISAFAEVPMLFFSKKIIHRFGLIKPNFLVVILTVSAQTIYAFSGDMWQLYIAQMLQGMANGLMMSCRIQYIYQLAPEGLGTTAMTAVGSVNAIIHIVFSLFGGFLLENLGIRSFYLMTDALLIIPCLFFVLSFPIGLKVLKKAPPKAFSFRG